MPDKRSFDQAATSASTMQAALSLGHRLDLWSLLLAVLALACLCGLSLPWLPGLGLLASVFAAGVQKFFALRVAFDEELFRHLARQWAVKESQKDASLLAELTLLDQSLALFTQRPLEEGAVRDLDSRMQGASSLLKSQVLAFFVQFATMLSSAALGLLPAA